jgi:hypothetical protein
LPLAVIAVIVADDDRFRVDGVFDGAAEAVTRETHCCYWRELFRIIKLEVRSLCIRLDYSRGWR